MWILYDPVDLAVFGVYHLKNQAKRDLKYRYNYFKNGLTLEKLKGLSVEQWKTFKILTKPYVHSSLGSG